jgi:hypothetical protein
MEVWTLLLSAKRSQTFHFSRLVKPSIKRGEKDIRAYPLPKEKSWGKMQGIEGP